MSREIVIGDVHGCYYTLQKLLSGLSVQPHLDKLIFLGDVIGKGPHSGKVLDFMLSYPQCEMVLGNHEISWLRHCFYEKYEERQDFEDLLNDERAALWLSYVMKQPFLISTENGMLVHASLDYSWDLSEATGIADTLSKDLVQDPEAFFQGTEKPEINRWKDDLTAGEKRYLALQIFTRARYYDQDGVLSLESTAPPESQPNLVPWYEKTRVISAPVCFGHWASLAARDLPHDYHLDGGAVYGGKLVAMDLASKERWTQDRVAEDE